MFELSETMRDYLAKNAGRVFSEYPEEAFQAVGAVCRCLEFLENQEEWRFQSALGSRIDRAIPTRGEWQDEEQWKESFQKSYDEELRREEMENLEEKLDSPEEWPGGDAPFYALLRSGIRMLTYHAINPRFRDKGWKRWGKAAEARILAGRYPKESAAFQGVQEAVCLLGTLELCRIQTGESVRWRGRDVRDAVHFQQMVQEQIPQAQREAYDRGCARITDALSRAREDAMRRTLAERDERLEKNLAEKGGIPALDCLRGWIDAMDDDAFRKYVRESLAVEEWADNGQIERWECERLAIQRLAERFVYAGQTRKERLFRSLSQEQQTAALECWMSYFYPTNRYGLLEKLKHTAPWYMECFEDEEGSYERVMRESMSRILGRQVTEAECPVRGCFDEEGA